MQGVLSATASQIAHTGVWSSLAENVWKAGTTYIRNMALLTFTPNPLPNCVNSELALALIVARKIYNLLFGNKTTQNKEGIYEAYFIQSIVLTASIAADFWKDSRAFYVVMGIGLFAIAGEDRQNRQKASNLFLGFFLLSTITTSTVASTIFLLSGQLTAVGVVSLVMYPSCLLSTSNKEKSDLKRKNA